MASPNGQRAAGKGNSNKNLNAQMIFNFAL